MTRVLVAVPWRAQPHRVYAHDLTVARYKDLLPDAVVVDVDTDHHPFCLAGCRNAGVRAAERRGAGVAVLADADTLPERGPLLAAIEGAATSNVVHLPYDRYHSLRAAGTAQFQAGIPLEQCDHLHIDGACSGVYVTTPSTWWAHGGQDELFRGWGFEDAAWWAAHVTLLGAEPVRHPGRVYALTHESQVKEGEQYAANAGRCFRYHQAQGDQSAMRTLIAEQRTTDSAVLAVPSPCPPSHAETSPASAHRA